MIYDHREHPHPFTPTYATREAWKLRADFLRRQIRVALGLWPMPEKRPLNPVIHGATDCGDYVIEKVYFASLRGHYVSGNLYRPRILTDVMPAVLCPHGHWKDGRLGWNSDDHVAKETLSGAEHFESAARNPLQARGVALARAGFVAFLYDMVGFGDSDAIKHPEGFTDLAAVLQGQSFMELQTWNSIRALDFLCELSYVDKSRIAVTGASSGGLQTLMLGAIDPRPACLFAGAMISATMQGGCVCENAPLLRIGTNNVEIAALFAPKPFGFATANDWTRDFLDDGLPQLKSIYSLFNAASNVEATHVAFGHNDNSHSRSLGYEFIRQHLVPQSAPIVERDFVAQSPSQLSVWTVDHPRPADRLDAVPLRKQMHAPSNSSVDAWSALVNDDVFNVGTINRIVTRSFMLTCNIKNGIPTIEMETDQTSMKFESAGSAFDLSNETRYLGYALGCNAPTVARRALAVLWIIRSVRKGSARAALRMYCDAGFGHAGLIAAAIAGTLIDHCEVDLKHFDFDDADLADSNGILLPGAMKYGGVEGLLALCDSSRVTVHNRKGGR